jgi:hypothetical protein
MLNASSRPCLDAVQIMLYSHCPKNEIGERATHGLILFTHQSTNRRLQERLNKAHPPMKIPHQSITSHRQ